MIRLFIEWIAIGVLLGMLGGIWTIEQKVDSLIARPHITFETPDAKPNQIVKHGMVGTVCTVIHADGKCPGDPALGIAPSPSVDVMPTEDSLIRSGLPGPSAIWIGDSGFGYSYSVPYVDLPTGAIDTYASPPGAHGPGTYGR